MAAAGPFLLLIVPFFYARVIDFPGTIKNTIWYIQQPHSIHMYFVLILYPSSIVIVLISHKTLSLPVLCCHFLLLTLSLPSYRGTNRPPLLYWHAVLLLIILILYYSILVLFVMGLLGYLYITIYFFINFFLWNHSLMHFERYCYFLSFVVTSYETKSFLLVKTVTLSFYITYVPC